LHAAKIYLFVSTRLISLLVSQKYHTNTNKAGYNIVETSSNRPRDFFSPGEAFVFEFTYCTCLACFESSKHCNVLKLVGLKFH
jgi:hypothetical protein